MHYDRHGVEDAIFEEIDEVTYEIWTSHRRASSPTWVRVDLPTLDEAAGWIATYGNDELFEIRDSLGNVYMAAGEGLDHPPDRRSILSNLPEEVRVRLKLYGIMFAATIVVEAIFALILTQYGLEVDGSGKFIIIFMITAVFMPLRERGAQ